MTPENHDAAFAAVSHLPHLLAFAYFSAVAKQPAGKDFLALAGPGFRDFTRIAASDPAIWRDILVSNREEILKQSLRFRHTLDALEHVMRSGNVEALEDLLRQARRSAGRLADERRRQAARRALTAACIAIPFLDLPPLGAAAGTVSLPGSKSISNRVLLLAGLASGTTAIHDLLDSDDTRVMLAALRQLGCRLERDGDALRVHGLGGQLGGAAGLAVPRQCRHRDAPAGRGAGGPRRAAGRPLRIARCGTHARAADRRPGGRIAPAGLPRSTSSAPAVTRRWR